MSALRVVVAEDEPLIREELISMIPWEELDLILAGQAGDGLTALKTALEEQADVLITDVRMPGMDGLSVIQEVKKKRDVSCVVISGYSEFDYALQAIRLGVANYLLKPVDEALFVNTLRHIRQEREEQGTLEEGEPKETLTHSQNRYIRQILEFIDVHYAEDISISSLAAKLHLSEGYVSKLFSRHMGQRFTEYLNAYRIMKAVHLLKNTNFKVYEISRMVGYSDARYFGIVFKNITGKTPADYRRG